MNSAAQIAYQFLDNQQKIQKEGLREYSLKKLTMHLNWVSFWVQGSENVSRWNSLADYISSHDREPEYETWKKGLDQIMIIPKTIKGWINDHVDSVERLEFSISSKAAELASGDDLHDYYMALTIRHDQLLACVEVLGDAVVKLGEIIKMNDNQAILESEAFGFFASKEMETYIYELAQSICSERESQES